MAESIVQDWLADYRRVQGKPAELSSFAVEHETDPEIAEAIYTIFSEHHRHESLVHAICQQLLAFYRSPEDALRKFPLQFIPVLIYTYLHAVAAGDKKGARSVETLLICIYNAEVSMEDGSQRVVSFRMPILAQASVYHEEKNLPITDLRRWEENCNREIKWGPYNQIEAITAQNRLRIMTALLFCYNQQVSLTQKSALIHLCRVASHLVNQGFSKQHTHRISYGSDSSGGSMLPKSMTPRIPLSSAFLVELVHAIYFAMFNGFGTVAIQTLEDIHQRACFEMFTELMLVTNAVRNSLHANPSGQPSDGPMGLSVALTPATNTVTTSVSKSMITNASFRTKKLPDDIPIQIQDMTMQQIPHQQLASVTEEVEQHATKEQQTATSRNSIIRPSMEGIKAQAHKALIAGFKKSKDKEKEREREKEREKEKDGKISGGGNSNEPPKPPLRKFDKHNQRNSLLQLQAEGSAMVNADYEKSPSSAGLKAKAYDTLDATVEMLPMQTLLNNENGSGSFSIDSELNGMNNVINNTNSVASNTNSITSSDLITKSFDSSIEIPPIGGSGKVGDIGMD